MNITDPYWLDDVRAALIRDELAFMPPPFAPYPDAVPTRGLLQIPIEFDFDFPNIQTLGCARDDEGPERPVIQDRLADMAINTIERRKSS